MALEERRTTQRDHRSKCTCAAIMTDVLVLTGVPCTGLQCHIVKNHEQPKGTIGSLERALERYGVPVKEVEDFERDHGRGTAGTMADPKNLKMKLKTKIQDFSRNGTPGLQGIDLDARPAGYRPSPTATDDSPTISDGFKKSPDTGAPNGFNRNVTTDEVGRCSAPQTATASPANAFTAVRPGWMGINNPSPMPPKNEPWPKSLQGDLTMYLAAQNEPAPTSQPGASNGSTLLTPPSTRHSCSSPNRACADGSER